MKMRILASVDYSKEIGTGHFRRTVYLLNELGQSAYVLLSYVDDFVNNSLKGKEIQLVESNVVDTIERVCWGCKYVKPDLLILDYLHYSSDFVKEKNVGCKIVSFHEYRDETTDSNLAVNYNAFTGFNLVKQNKFLAGIEFFPINNTVIKKKEIGSDGYYVCFGGSDPNNITARFIENVVVNLPSIKFCIQVGPLYSYDLERFESFKLKNVIFVKRPYDIWPNISKYSHSITSAGTMMYELVYAGFRPIVISHNEHQEEFAQNLEELGEVVHLGNHANLNWSEVCGVILKEFKTRGVYVSQYIDEKGIKRLKTEILRLAA